jgi:hypothetical protein
MGKLLLLLGAAVTLGGLAFFQHELLQQDADEENFVTTKLLQADQNAVIQYDSIYKRLNVLEVASPNVGTTNVISQPTLQVSKSQTLNDQNAHMLPSESQDGFPHAHQDFAKITFFVLLFGSALLLFGALIDFILLLEINGKSPFIQALTALLATVLTVLGYFYIPVVFGGLALLHLTGRFKVDWVVILLACLALCPQLFPLIAKYMEEVSFGLQGFRAKARAFASTVQVGSGTGGGGDAGGGGGPTANEPPSPTPPLNQGRGETFPAGTTTGEHALAEPASTLAAAVPLQPPAETIPPRSRVQEPLAVQGPTDVLIPQSRKILKTLWHYQKTLYLNTPTTRWCFTVGSRAPDYMTFSLGLLELIRADFVGIDSNGFAFLNDRGLAYCQRHDLAVLAYPEMYDTFGPA